MPSLPLSPLLQKKSRSNKPKIFQCTGYGDCQMVFSRSEHLARHTRKHTGEKPYLCIVPGCTRKFSRFDNMMQHTQTHKTRSYSMNVKSIKETTPESMTDTSSSASSSSSSDDDTPVPLNKEPVLKELYLTQDEFEALQGLGQFRHTPIFIDSFQDCASAVYITPNPQQQQQQQQQQ